MEEVLLVAGIGAVFVFSMVRWIRARPEIAKPRQQPHRQPRQRHRSLSSSQEWHGVNWDAWSPPQRRSSHRQKPNGAQTVLFLPPPKSE